MKPALLLPLRFIDTADINNSFDGNFASRQINYSWQTNDCYFQKWQFTDTLRLQIISNEELTDLKILNLDGAVVDTVSWVANALVLPDYPDYKVYEINYPFANLTAGKYVIQQDLFEAEAIEVAEKWDKTVLLKYKHSENDYSVIFDTLIEFEFRVEGWVGDYKPKNDRDVYNDQTRNLTQLNSVAYRQFSLYVGYGKGVPNWPIDKVNIITQCDQLKIDNVYYQPIEDAEFEVENNDAKNYIGGSIEIEQKFNNFIKIRTEGQPTNQTFQPVQNVTPYLNQGANFNVNGLFKFNSLLEAIAVYRNTSAPLIIKLGITPNGNEIGEIELIDFENTLQLNYLFDTARTVYITGITPGADVTIFFIWKQLDVLPIPIAPPTDTASELGKGSIISWKEINAGDFLLNWDMVTGLGKTNTKWAKWCILGSNGTLPPEINSNDMYLRHVGYEQIETNYVQLNTVIGANQKVIPRSALPNERLFTLTTDQNNNPNDFANNASQVAIIGDNRGQRGYAMARGGSEATVGRTNPLGDGAEFSVEPKTLVTLFIIKLVD